MAGLVDNGWRFGGTSPRVSNATKACSARSKRTDSHGSCGTRSLPDVLSALKELHAGADSGLGQRGICTCDVGVVHRAPTDCRPLGRCGVPDQADAGAARSLDCFAPRMAF